MTHDVSTRRPLERSDYYSLGLIILYAIYVYLSIEGVFDALIVGSDQPGWLTLSNYLVPLAAFGLALLSIGKQQSMPEDWGLSLGKRFLPALGAFLVGGIVFGLFAGNFPPSHFYIQIVPAILVVAAGQIVLRARLMSLIRKFMGTTVTSSIVMFSLGALVFALVYTPVVSFGFWVILLSCVAVWFIRGSGSVLLLIYIEPFIFRKSELNEMTQNTFLAFCVVAAVIYFAIAVPAWLIHRSRSQGSRVGDDRT